MRNITGESGEGVVFKTKKKKKCKIKICQELDSYAINIKKKK